MEDRILFRTLASLLFLIVLLACTDGKQRPIEDIKLFQKVTVTPAEQKKKDDILTEIMSQSLPDIEAAIREAEAKDKSFFDQGIDRLNMRNTTAFGPHMITKQRAIDIGAFGQRFGRLTKSAAEMLNISAQNIDQQLSSQISFLNPFCPFLFNRPDCTQAATSRYRTIDGTCNNLNKTLWGQSFTPFERMLPAVYDNVDQPRERSTSGVLLPLARKISSQFHQSSLLSNLMPDLSHMAMEFGQFLSHDIQRNALSTGYLGSTIDCCSFGLQRGDPCFPMEIPTDDPYYSQFGRTCMNFVRAISTPKLDCTLGQRQQLNQNTHYIDGSQIYGSDAQTSYSLREFVGGKLQTGGDPNIQNMLPKDPFNRNNCNLPNNDPNVQCFRAGDDRVNQQPALISLHTIFMREHNRIAAGLAALNSNWSDQMLYDEARKIVGAMLQHITYNEYLPEILGQAAMNAYGLKSLAKGYFNGYDNTLNAAIKNEFSAAAFRFGHSMIHDSLKYNNGAQTLKDVFLNPATVYDTAGGIDSITKGLTDSYSQKVDERLSDQLTKHLFERQPGFGDDLAATNIQRGRDHGIPSYQQMKDACNVKGLVHDQTVWTALSALYQNASDIDLFSAGVSETPVAGGKIGPTFACIIGKQFEALKKGDRYFYENAGSQAFTLAQLDEIRQTTLAKVICRNTGIATIPSRALVKNGTPMLKCSDVSDVAFNKWL
ncbi:hypothetical protein ACJMK2_026210 [Sinanodonta woodiana]|uniref:Peroxidase n=1 Tax=Sinanodonta woodiana TaxID=1069815 RepID=A0ABD3XKQ6_SINWO